MKDKDKLQNIQYYPNLVAINKDIYGIYMYTKHYASLFNLKSVCTLIHLN